MHEECVKRESRIAAAWAKAEDEANALKLQNREMRNALEKIASCDCLCVIGNCVVCVAKGALIEKRKEEE